LERIKAKRFRDYLAKGTDIFNDDTNPNHCYKYSETCHSENLNKLRTNIFQVVSHTVSNIMLANKSITKRIRNGTSSMNDINRLELLNELVLSTMKAVKLAFSNEDIVLSQAQDDLFSGKINDGISLHDILCLCLNINLYHLVIGEGEEAWETIRNIFFSINKYDKKRCQRKTENA